MEYLTWNHQKIGWFKKRKVDVEILSDYNIFFNGQNN